MQALAQVKKILLHGMSVYVPEIADYELRRELLRIKSSRSITRLDQLKVRLNYAPITTEAMLNAAELWAAARHAGKPTADEKALDAGDTGSRCETSTGRRSARGSAWQARSRGVAGRRAMRG